MQPNRLTNTKKYFTCLHQAIEHLISRLVILPRLEYGEVHSDAHTQVSLSSFPPTSMIKTCLLELPYYPTKH